MRNRKLKDKLSLILEIIILISFLIAGGAMALKGNIPIHPVPFLDIEMLKESRFTSERNVEAKYYQKLANNMVQCQLCFRRCTIPDGGRGYCTNRVNRKGTLYTLVYGHVTAQIDPVEKEPLLHFLPGTTTLCFGTAGCNLRCTFCHNWHLSTRTQEELRLPYLSPQEAVSKARGYGCSSISFTYNEPTVFYEWVYDVCRIAKQKGLRVYLHTNGAINKEPLEELLKYLDAVCVDLKGFTAEFYRETSFSHLEPVLSTLKTIKKSGVWFEITCLIIPTLNDDPAKIREMCIWIRDNLGKETPVHFSRFFPAYKLTRLPPTPIETLERARDIAMKVGLEYVTIGNVPGHVANSTFCPKCKKVVIRRIHFQVLENNIRGGKCKFCNHRIPGVWE